jgi:hypothetical protein
MTVLQPDQFGDRDRALLDAAGRNYQSRRRRTEALSDAYEDLPHRAVARMNTLLDHPEAEAYAPATVHNLRAQRDAARGRR